MMRLAVVGCGYWGPNHVRVFGATPGCRVEVVVDPDPERLARIQNLYPSIRVTTGIEAVLADPSIDAVVVSTPTSTHYRLTREFLLAGKHVLCEKPLCLSSAEGQDLVDLASERGLVLMVGHVFLFNPSVVKMKAIVTAGELGPLSYLAATRTNLGPFRSDVNAAYDLASHDISVFNWLIGSEPLWVSATGASIVRKGVEDVVVLSIRYPGEILATVRASWLDPKKVRHMVVVGASRMLTWDDLEPGTPLAIYDKGARLDPDLPRTDAEYADFGEYLRLSTWDGDVKLPKIHFEEPLKAQAAAFARAIETGRVERSGGPEALGVVRVLEAAARSMRQHGVPVTLSGHEAPAPA